MFFYISEQLMILKQTLKLIEVVVDVNYVRVWQACLYEIAKRLEQFRFSATGIPVMALVSGTPIRLVNAFIYAALLMSFISILPSAAIAIPQKRKLFSFEE